MENNQVKLKRVFAGEVVSKSDKTLVVKVDRKKMHEKYQKQYTVTKKYHIHDEKNQAKVGDLVEFTECRPISKTKRWYLTKVVKA